MAMTFSARWERLVLFVSRQPRDVWEGGWPVLVRKLLMTLEVALAVPFVLAARLLRPLVLIWFGGLPSESIGHLSIDMELFLCRKDAGWYGRRTMDLFCCALPVCNQQLKRMWERTVHVSRFALAAERINRCLPGGRGNRIPFDQNPINADTHGLLVTSPPHLRFTPGEQRQGADALRRLGIPESRPFVCFIARDSAYYADRARYQDASVMRHRRSDIRAYLPAIDALVQRGYVGVRMGAAVEQPLPTRHAEIIDYASSARTDFLDIFLCAQCHFYLGDGAGLYNVPIIFRRPVALVNYIPMEYTVTWNPQDLFIPKTLWLKSEGRVMTFREIVASGVGCYTRSYQYEPRGIEAIDNTPEEITALALEMEARRAGTWQATKEDEELQRRFWEICRAYTTAFASAPWRTHWRIGAEFLRQHPELLEDRTTPQATVVCQR